MPENTYLTLSRRENQALGIGRYAIDFVRGHFPGPSPSVLARLELFHTDSIACAVAALATGANAPLVLRREALEYACAESHGATCFGGNTTVQPEKAVLANGSAVRELDANGTNFGHNERTGNSAGEFGHNDFYPVAVAAAQIAGADGATTLRAMLCLDEIRGRLAEVFSLKTYKLDHVLHGAIASAAVYGAIVGATAEQIESAIGQVVAHFVPFRAIRHGHQLSDSKGASAAISAEVAVVSLRRAMRGFIGPADIFRNREAVFCLYQPGEKETSPFDLALATGGDDFAIMGMHFKLGLYEHQSAGAIEGVFQMLAANPRVLENAEALRRVRITIYEPAYSIIGDPHKRDPRTRQSADHSMLYIVATLLRKAFTVRASGWKELMLTPDDYNDAALFDPLTRSLMQRIDFVHGGPEYDAKYPDGIPTTVELEHAELGRLSSGLVMYPAGHARNRTADLADLLAYKFEKLAGLGVRDVAALRARLANLGAKTAREIRAVYDFPIDDFISQG